VGEALLTGNVGGYRTGRIPMLASFISTRASFGHTEALQRSCFTRTREGDRDAPRRLIEAHIDDAPGDLKRAGPFLR